MPRVGHGVRRVCTVRPIAGLNSWNAKQYAQTTYTNAALVTVFRESGEVFLYSQAKRKKERERSVRKRPGQTLMQIQQNEFAWAGNSTSGLAMLQLPSTHEHSFYLFN